MITVNVNAFVEDWIRKGGRLSDTLKAVLLRSVQGAAPSASVKKAAGLPDARQAGRKRGRPKKLNREEILTFRKAGRSWEWIARRLGVRASSARRAANEP